MKRFKAILCIVEPGETYSPALERATKLAESNQASLTVAIGMPKEGPTSNELEAAMMEECQAQLAALVEPYRQQVDIDTQVLSGVPFLEIIREVLRHNHDLVIKAPETADWLDRLFGSDDMQLLRKCPCPVWLIKPETSKSYRRILAAVDVDVNDNYPPSELEKRRSINRQILQMAGSLALSEFAELHVVHAWNAIGESTMRGGFMRMPEKDVTDYVEQVRRQHANSLKALLDEVASGQGSDMLTYLKPKTHLVKGWARREIPALAKEIDADLVVMGTVARTGIPGFFMGNTAETILNQIDCSVLAIKPPGFVTPITLEE